MKTENLFHETHRATYSPEDNKLRLYVGRVPRDQYEALRAEGWTALHKQREAGGGDFAAVWTPQRRDTALAFAGIIEDEDMGPDERAADRAERFMGYQGKRLDDATGHADRYEAGPSAHGFQSQARAERAAARHDRIGTRATDAWEKAEYWQRRTAGVIAHALYVSSPAVRMGRIKTLEAELRGKEQALAEYANLWRDFQKLNALEDGEAKTATVLQYLGARNIWADYVHPRPEEVKAAVLAGENPNKATLANYYATRKTSLYTLMSSEYAPITGAEACALFLSNHREPRTETDWTTHLKLRLAYENQMLEAQGGRLAHVEIQPGGKLGGRLIVKANKSAATGRVVSVHVLGPKVDGWTYRAQNVPGTEYALHQFDTERLAPGAYTPPDEASIAELEAFKKAKKASAPKKEPCPLINPTDEDAERLQALWNAHALASREAAYKRMGYSLPVRDCEPQTVLRITQATYSAASKGAYARAETREVFPGGHECGSFYDALSKGRAKYGREVCQVRRTSGKGTHSGGRVIILTDKPQKPLPAAVWQESEAIVTA